MDDEVENNDMGDDEDMGAVQEDIGDEVPASGATDPVENESEEETGIVHEDVEDEISSMLLAQLGQSGKSYRRELRKSYKHLVSEIYSPPRITKEIRRGRYRNLAP